jgi:AAA domain
MIQDITAAANGKPEDAKLTEEINRSFGGIMCDCSPESNRHMRMPIAPTGMCEFCGAKGMWHDEAVRNALASGHFDTHIPDTPLPAWLREEAPAREEEVNPLLDANGFVIWEAAFKAQPEQVQWIVEPVIEAGKLHSFFGPAQAGKTLVSMELSCRIIDSGRKVLYVDNENGIREWVERLTAMGRTPDNLSGLYCRPYSSMPPLDTPAGGRELLRLAHLAKADVVWIDTTSRFIQGRENDSDTFIAVYSCSLMPLKEKGIAVVRLDHTGKDEDRGQRGSSAKEQDLDYIWRIQSDGKLTRTITCMKSRSSRPLKQGDKITLTVHGVTPDNPVFYHEWDYRTPTDPDVALLESLGIPASTPRRKVHELLKAAGKKMGSPSIDKAQAIRRKMYESGEDGTASLFVPDGFGTDDPGSVPERLAHEQGSEEE